MKRHTDYPRGLCTNASSGKRGTIVGALALGAALLPNTADAAPYLCDAHIPVLRLTDFQRDTATSATAMLQFNNWTSFDVHGIAFFVTDTETDATMQGSIEAGGRPVFSGDDDCNYPPADGTQGTFTPIDLFGDVFQASGKSIWFTFTDGTPVESRDLTGCALERVPGFVEFPGVCEYYDQGGAVHANPDVYEYDEGLNPHNSRDGVRLTFHNWPEGEALSLGYFLLKADGPDANPYPDPVFTSWAFGAFNLVEGTENPIIWTGNETSALDVACNNFDDSGCGGLAVAGLGDAGIKVQEGQGIIPPVQAPQDVLLLSLDLSNAIKPSGELADFRVGRAGGVAAAPAFGAVGAALLASSLGLAGIFLSRRRREDD